MVTSRRILFIFLALMLAFFVVALWYKYEYAMDIAEEFEINNPQLQQQLLIATQGSEFKDAVRTKIINHYKSDSIFIKVIDISSLPKIKHQDYYAVLLIHTWENWQPPKVVENFVNKNREYRKKLVVLTTSGEGSYKMDEVDAITGESKLENVVPFTDKIIKRLDSVLMN